MNTPSIEPLDAPRCPLCGRPNACAAAAAGRFDVACWCATEEFPPALLARVPADARNRACICRDCVRAFQAEAAALAQEPVHSASARS